MWTPDDFDIRAGKSGPPKRPQDLTEHDCINLRLPTHGGLYAWEFEKSGREVNVRVNGQLIFGTSGLILAAARSGLGLAYLTEEQVSGDLKSGRLVRVLGDWCPPFSGYHLYYPSRRQPTQAFTLLVDALRYRPPQLVKSSGRTCCGAQVPSCTKGMAQERLFTTEFGYFNPAFTADRNGPLSSLYLARPTGEAATARSFASVYLARSSKSSWSTARSLSPVRHESPRYSTTCTRCVRSVRSLPRPNM
jgi:hypothetical protein